MNPEDRNDEPTDLLRELENLQRVLDDAAGEHGADIPVLEPMDDIPVLDDLFNADEVPTLRAVNAAVSNVTPLRPQTPAVEAEPTADADTALEEAPQLKEAEAVVDTDLAVPAIAETPAEPVSPAVSTQAPKASISANPFLPQSVLDRLAQEREAAQHSAEEAHRTMQRVMEQKQQRAQTGISDLGNRLSPAQKERMIEQLVAEMLPEITEKLKDRLRNMLR
ncbi:hypothetical protein [Thalassolituus marinus]|uniref:Uncharacterized protein n=1 Tax=Thalassolituus marinus TaxID=671053 RepID=A0ABS7ZUT0_9GAMM|nr:hypothetical protein [Thalassolituus marinus]MCA6065337.1 hypothetical protein [Thalassolituus marinus]